MRRLIEKFQDRFFYSESDDYRPYNFFFFKVASFTLNTSLHHLKRTSFRAAVFSVLGMPRNHMALSSGYMENVLGLSHQFQSVLPMPQQQYVTGHYPGAKTTVSWANPVFSSSWLQANVFSGRLHNSRRSLSAYVDPSAVRSSRAHQRTAEAWLYPPRWTEFFGWWRIRVFPHTWLLFW